jgi:hypothetical protein
MIDSKLLLYMVLNEFGGLSLGGFDDRLTLQKRIYLLQRFGVDLDYRYNWYVRGPYCPQLTEDAFGAQSGSADLRIQAGSFELTDESRNAIELYKSFEKQLSGGDLPLLLELAASIHYLLHVGFLPGGKSLENMRQALRDRGKQFSDSQFQTAWTALDSAGLIERGALA